MEQETEVPCSVGWDSWVHCAPMGRNYMQSWARIFWGPAQQLRLSRTFFVLERPARVSRLISQGLRAVLRISTDILDSDEHS